VCAEGPRQNLVIDLAPGQPTGTILGLEHHDIRVAVLDAGERRAESRRSGADDDKASYDGVAFTRWWRGTHRRQSLPDSEG